ncbi:signal peptidase 22kDa subunit [Rhodocollybia butyracea]|uniref:Signal peptidase subunit 3 n=1 Tax=Rhodocollybia butyracea TaxID=206335 RepID=A0A9P5UCV0_9AGAR|nr:signal peptidase 22kDa subunit [Rhodocollybia butyracea]
MHSLFTRINNVSALLSSCVMSLVIAITLASLLQEAIFPPQVDGQISMRATMVYQAKAYRQKRKQEMGFLNFNMTADLSPLFTWNTKQLFVSLEAEYENIKGVNNTIVLWDRIVRRPEDAKVNVVGARNKYAFKEVGGKGFGKGVAGNASYALKYNLMPYMGVLRYGEVTRLSNVPFEVREEL